MYSGTLWNVASMSRRKVNGKRKPVILTFTSSATWTVPHGVSEVDVFLVGGGGAGGEGITVPGYGAGGGGGGGGGNILQKPAIHVTPGENKSIIVGGSAGTTSFGTLSVNGGSQGANASAPNNQAAVGGGGNSGGGGGSYESRQGGSGGTQTAGGTGHANGGPRLLSAVASSFDSSDFVGVLYGNGGGGGAVDRSGGLGGVGAGNGGNNSAEATNGTSNSGGGGGGGGYSNTSGKSGGSGLVQIRYWKE